MNRIEKKFAELGKSGEKAYVAYLTMGAPTLPRSYGAFDTLVAEGADILELGIPFSDPAADGTIIRKAAVKALENGVTLADVLKTLPTFRARHPDVPIVLFSYYNVIYSYGIEAFAADAAAAGADGVLVVDLPYEERDEILPVLKAHGLVLVPLIAPTTDIERVKGIASGMEDSFLYAVTVKGVTGKRAALPEELASRLREIKAAVSVPVVAGFGIRDVREGSEVATDCDGFVIGSALVERFNGTF